MVTTGREDATTGLGVDVTVYLPPEFDGAPVLELGLDAESAEPARRKRWAWFLKHVSKADLDTCVRCGGPMRWLEAAKTREAACDLLARLGLGPRPPPSGPTPSLGQLVLPFMR